MIISKEEIDFLQEVYNIQSQNEIYKNTFQSILNLLDSNEDTRPEIRFICNSVLDIPIQKK